MEDTVSVVITSFNRRDLLERCITTFNMVNQYPIAEFIIVEDSGDKDMHEWLKVKYPQYKLILNEKTLGQIDSIDLAYSQVNSPYVFHSEDDYEYFKSGFIERSLAVLKAQEDVMQIWIRRVTDVLGQPIEPQLYSTKAIDSDRKVDYYLIGEHQEWYGFCFQCGLRKMSAYDRVRPYSQWSPITDFPSQRECKIGIALWKLGYKAAILPEGYARHKGELRSVSGNKLK
jgi:glycosyltransferase involved in cell wall biosynthesis